MLGYVADDRRTRWNGGGWRVWTVCGPRPDGSGPPIAPTSVSLCGVLAPAEQDVGVHLAATLDLDAAAMAGTVVTLQVIPGREGDLHVARQALGFHPARHVDRVAPQVVGEL